MSPIAEIPPAPAPEPIPRSAGLRALLENALTRFLVNTLNRVKESVAELLRYAVERSFENLEQDGAELAAPFVDRILAIPDLPPDVRRVLERARSPTSPAALAAVVPILVGLVLVLVHQALSPLGDLVRYVFQHVFHSFRLDYGTLRAASWRDESIRERLARELKDQGWTDEQIAVADLASERLPTGSDLVLFALREAWDDAVAEKYGYDADYSSEFGYWMKQQGYLEDWAQKYWRSHWQVPSVGYGFQMMHRAIISRDELIDLMRVGDIPAFWRDKLIDLAYNTYTRVDTRRMYAAGVLDESQVYRSYLDQGYDPVKARALTNFAIADAVSETKGLTRAAIQKAYGQRRLSYDEAISMLGDIGIQANVAAFYLAQVDQDRYDELMDKRIAAVKTQFLAGLLTESEVFEALGALGVSSDEIRADLEIWRVSLMTKEKRPSRTNLDSFFLSGIIGVDTYRQQMELLNYADTYVDWYLASLAIKRQQVAESEERAAREEQERIRVVRLKTDYQREKAIIDVDIAELQTAIADSQVALVEAQNERDQKLAAVMSVAEIAALEREYRPLFFEIDAAVSTARLRISELQAAIGEREAAISGARGSLAANRDVPAQERLRANRLALDAGVAEDRKAITARQLEIARLKARAPEVETEAEAEQIAKDLLRLDVEIAEFNDAIAQKRVRIEEIDVALRVTLSEVQRQELQVQIAMFQVEIATLNSEIDDLRAAIQDARTERAIRERQLEERIAELPGREEQIKIESDYALIIDEIERRITEFRANITALRLAKGRLTVEYREA